MPLQQEQEFEMAIIGSHLDQLDDKSPRADEQDTLFDLKQMRQQNKAQSTGTTVDAADAQRKKQKEAAAAEQYRRLMTARRIIQEAIANHPDRFSLSYKAELPATSYSLADASIPNNQHAVKKRPNDMSYNDFVAITSTMVVMGFVAAVIVASACPILGLIVGVMTVLLALYAASNAPKKDTLDSTLAETSCPACLLSSRREHLRPMDFDAAFASIPSMIV